MGCYDGSRMVRISSRSLSGENGFLMKAVSVPASNERVAFSSQQPLIRMIGTELRIFLIAALALAPSSKGILKSISTR
ncbi:MAG: hypothetical protein ACI91J_003586 [Yoonia sp.]|jgi:hypothetical protein